LFPKLAIGRTRNTSLPPRKTAFLKSILNFCTAARMANSHLHNYFMRQESKNPDRIMLRNKCCNQIGGARIEAVAQVWYASPYAKGLTIISLLMHKMN